jgi:hypothetical protein
MKVDKSLLQQMDKDNYHSKSTKRTASRPDNAEENKPCENTSKQPTETEKVANSTASISIPEEKSHIIGNCVAIHMGIKVTTGESEIKKNDMIVAVNKSIHTTFHGHVQLACVITGFEEKFGENCSFVGVRFVSLHSKITLLN